MTQEIVVITLVILATSYLMYRVKKKFFSSNKTCESCAFSPENKIPASKK
ncbi:MAG: hypothetical protein K9I37_03260 [Crocinitomicaceae bacterium]|nr:hypothetical protein [Crocinitomicaceae bacterium]